MKSLDWSHRSSSGHVGEEGNAAGEVGAADLVVEPEGEKRGGSEGGRKGADEEVEGEVVEGGEGDGEELWEIVGDVGRVGREVKSGDILEVG